MTLAEVAPEESDDVEAPAETSFSDEVFEDEDEEEALVPVSYEGIPSWEEAISYLQRRPRDSRQRGDNPSRGRGPHRR